MTDQDREKESYRVCKEFFQQIPKVRTYIESDLLAAFDGDPAAGCYEEIILAYPGLMAVTVQRIAHELYLLNIPDIGSQNPNGRTEPVRRVVLHNITDCQSQN